MQEAIIQALQDLRSGFWDTTFVLATTLGEEVFIIAVVTLVYWNISKRSGYILVTIYLASVVVNDLLKLTFHTRRPYEVLSGVSGLRLETAGGFAFPSGHTQGATSLFIGLALLFRRNVIYVLAAAAIVLVGVSRLYLGVHWPVDVLGGWVFGAVVAVLVYRLLSRRKTGGVEAPGAGAPGGVAARGDYPGFRAVLAAGVVLIGLALGISLLGAGVSDLFRESSMANIAGVSLGLILGFLLERSYVGFSCDAAPLRKVLRYILGLGSTAGILIGLGVLVDSVEGRYLLQFWAELAQYLVVGTWAVGIYPLLGRRVGLF